LNTEISLSPGLWDLLLEPEKARNGSTYKKIQRIYANPVLRMSGILAQGARFHLWGLIVIPLFNLYKFYNVL